MKMNDIVERLRKEPVVTFVEIQLCHEAADEIERLRDDLKHSDEVRQSALQSLLSAENEIERLREALEDEIAGSSKAWAEVLRLQGYIEELEGTISIAALANQQLHKENKLLKQSIQTIDNACQPKEEKEDV